MPMLLLDAVIVIVSACGLALAIVYMASWALRRWRGPATVTPITKENDREDH